MIDLYTFRYKDGEGPEGLHVGPIAQELENDPLGRHFVHRDDEGIRHVDTDSLHWLYLKAALNDAKARRAA